MPLLSLMVQRLDTQWAKTTKIQTREPQTRTILMGLMRLGDPGQEIPVAREHGKYLTCAPHNRYRRRLPHRKRNIRARAALKDGQPELAGAMRVGAFSRNRGPCRINQNYAAHAAAGVAALSVLSSSSRMPTPVVETPGRMNSPSGCAKYALLPGLADEFAGRRTGAERFIAKVHAIPQEVVPKPTLRAGEIPTQPVQTLAGAAISRLPTAIVRIL